MSSWMVLPVSLSVFTITGIWLVYAMALYNQHVCPVHNWLYNGSCQQPLSSQMDPGLCCTVDKVPFISECGTRPPESCIFSLVCSTSSFMAMLVVLLRYAHVIQRHQNCLLNMAALTTGLICSAGILMVGNFQVDLARALHYVGVATVFPCSVVFMLLQSALTYRLAKTQDEHRVGHVRAAMTLLALVTLPIGSVFFWQESYTLLHASSILEWLYSMLIMLFYGTFAFEFGDISGDTLMVLTRGAGVQSSPSSEHKAEVDKGDIHHQGLSILYLDSGVPAPPGGRQETPWSYSSSAVTRDLRVHVAQ